MNSLLAQNALSLLVSAACVVSAHAQSGRIAFDSSRNGGSHIFVMNAANGSVTQLTHHAGTHFSPAFSRDGSRIAFISTIEHPFIRNLFVMNADGSGVARLTHNFPRFPGDDLPGNGVGPQSPAFHPSGQFVAVHDNGSIQFVPLNTNAPTVEFTITSANDVTVMEFPAFSPDGTRIAFAGWTETETPPGSGIFSLNSDIYVANTNGSGLQRLTTHAGWDTSPSFSADGSRLVFSRQDDPSAGIYIVRVTGGSATKLTGSSDRAFTRPVFSPDNSQIAFSSTPAGSSQFELYRMSTNGTAITRLTTNTVDDLDPSWAAEFSSPALRLSVTRTNGATRPQLVFQGAPNQTYSLQLRTNLAAGFWRTVTNIVTGANGTGAWTATNGVAGPNAFYRVVSPAAP